MKLGDYMQAISTFNAAIAASPYPYDLLLSIKH
jgi:hypothetical protein